MHVMKQIYFAKDYIIFNKKKLQLVTFFVYLQQKPYKTQSNGEIHSDINDSV